MKRNCWMVILLLGIIICSTNGNALEMTAEKVMSFADHLYEKGDYYRAITEYERLTFYFPESPLAKKAKYQIAMSYLKGEKLTQAIQQFSVLSKSYINEELGKNSQYMLAESYYQLKEYNLAIEVLDEFLRIYPKDPQADAARVKKGICYLRQGMWQSADKEFENIPAHSSLGSIARGLAEESQKYPSIKKKSPYIAGTLSAILPGAGQLYIGRPRDAVVSLLLNGLFIWGAIAALDRGNNLTGGILISVESGWYLANIYSAVSGAHKYNCSADQRFMEQIENKYRISFYRDERKNSFLSLNVKF